MEAYLKEEHNEIRLWNSGILNFRPHFHEDVEIIFTLRGTATAYCNGTPYPLRQGSVFMAAPNEIHSYIDSNEQYNGYGLIVNPRLLSGSAAKLLHEVPHTPVWYDPNLKSEIWDLIKLAFAMQKSASQDSLLLLISTIISIIQERLPLFQATEQNQSTRQIIDYCRTHFRQPISLKLLSEQLHFSESYISHSFANILKTSLPDYINGLRLQEAVRLLKHTNLTVTEISAQAGFPTTRTFNRVFMKQYGVSPTQFRKNPKYI